MKKIILVLTSLALHACVSTLPMTNNQKQLLSSMNSAKADSYLKQTLKKTHNQSGVFATFDSIVKSSQVLKATKGVVEIRDSKQAGDGYIFYFNRIKTIRIISASAIKDGLVTSQNGTQFALIFTDGRYVNVDTSKNNSDKLITASLFFSPKAQLQK